MKQTMGHFSPQCVCLCSSPVSASARLVLSGHQETDEENTQQQEQHPLPSAHPVMRLDDTPTADLAKRRLSRTSTTAPDMASYRSSLTETQQETLSPHNEESVTEQTESIVRNYMYQRYQTDLQSEDSELAIATPRIPDFQCFTDNPLSPTSQIGRRLAQIGDQINSQYECEFREMITNLRITPATAYEAFAGVARRLFTQGINWGRIAALLSFGYQLAISIKAGIGEFFSNIISSIVRFIASERIAQWISEQGGWRSALTYQMETSESFRLFVVISVTAAATAGILYWFRK